MSSEVTLDREGHFKHTSPRKDRLKGSTLRAHLTEIRVKAELQDNRKASGYRSSRVAEKELECRIYKVESVWYSTRESNLSHVHIRTVHINRETPMGATHSGDYDEPADQPVVMMGLGVRMCDGYGQMGNLHPYLLFWLGS